MCCVNMLRLISDTKYSLCPVCGARCGRFIVDKELNFFDVIFIVIYFQDSCACGQASMTSYRSIKYVVCVDDARSIKATRARGFPSAYT